MVNYSAAALDATFGALADPTRRAILARLADAPESSVTDLALPFRMTLPAVSKYLRVLEDAGLMARRRDGRTHHCRIVAAPMREVSDWIARYREFWERRLDALQLYLDQTVPKEEKTAWSRKKPKQPAGSSSRGRSKRRATASSGRGRSRSS